MSDANQESTQVRHLQKNKPGSSATFLVPVFILSLMGTVFSTRSALSLGPVFDTLVFAAPTLLIFLNKNFTFSCFFNINLILIAFYIIASYIFSASTQNIYIGDFAVTYKSFVFLIMIYICAYAKLINRNCDILINITKSLLFAFFLIYFTERFIFSNARPTVFYENNYEICALSILVTASFYRRGNLEKIWIAMFCAILVMSASRSGVICGFVAVISTIKYRDIKDVLISAFAAALAALIILAVFQLRSDSQLSEQIDRVRFFQYFLFETRDWTFVDFLLGAPRVTPMSVGTCVDLEFYEGLISDINTGRCYSVVLHSFVMRSIFDHGLIVFSFLFVFLFNILRKTGLSAGQSAAIISILILNGFSVSALNSGIISFSIVTVVLLHQKQMRL